MAKETIIEELSNKLKGYINDAFRQYYMSMKEDIVGPNTFVRTVHLKTTDIEAKYVYHIDGVSREYICFYTDKDFLDLHDGNDKLRKSNSFSILQDFMRPLFNFADYFQTVKKSDVEDNTFYEWETFISKTLRDNFIHNNMQFPIARVIHQSLDNVMVLYMANYNKVTIFVLDAKDYKLNPEQDILDYLFENVIGVDTTNSNINCNNCYYNPLLSPMHQSIVNNQQEFAVNNAENNAEIQASLEPKVAASLKIVNKYY